MKIRIFLTLILAMSWSARGANIVAASLSQSDAQTAITAAGDGDTVTLPAGTATWASTVTWTNKQIAVVGAGQSSTIITNNAGSSAAFTVLTDVTAAKLFSISQMKLVGATSTGSLIDVGANSGTNAGMRIHHITFDISTRGISVQGHNEGGVIDHCTFLCSLNATCQGVTVYGDAGYNLVPGNTASSFPAGTAWATGSVIGTAKNIFIEDNTFAFDYVNDAAIEGYQGASFVARYNTIYNAEIGGHGLDSSVSSTKSVEVYNNTHVVQNIAAHKLFLELRGGTGVVWGNNQVVSWLPAAYSPGFAMTLVSYRSCGDDISYNSALRTTHNGANNATVFSNSGASYTVNQFVPSAHSPYTIFNRTDGSMGWITANTATTITPAAGLTGGTDNDFDSGDAISIYALEAGNQTGINPFDGNAPVSTGSGTHTGGSSAAGLTDGTKAWTTNQFVAPIQHTIWNRTDGSYGRITANTATTITAHMIGGTHNAFNPGDSYVVTYGYPGLEQVGWTGPVTLNATYSTMTQEPFYEWNNTLNGSQTVTSTTGPLLVQTGPVDDSTLSAEGNIRPYPSDAIVLNRDYYVNTPRPGYVSYTYPHPMQGQAASINAATINVGTLYVTHP